MRVAFCRNGAKYRLLSKTKRTANWARAYVSKQAPEGLVLGLCRLRRESGRGNEGVTRLCQAADYWNVAGYVRKNEEHSCVGTGGLTIREDFPLPKNKA